MAGMSTLREDNDGFDKQYMCDFDTYLMTLLSSLYGTIMDHVIHAHVHVNNVVDRLNVTEKHYLKEQMEIIGKLSSNNTSKIGIIPSASKDVIIHFSDQCIHILNNKYRLNGLKGGKKTKEIITIQTPITFLQCSKVQQF